MSKIRQLYFYIVSLIGLMMIVIPTADLINLGLKTWVFPKASEVEFGPYPGRPAFGPEGQVLESEKQAQERLQKEEEFAKRQRAAQRQRDIVRDLSFLIVGIPLFGFHFRIVQREKNRD